jgi:hypothetical protein
MRAQFHAAVSALFVAFVTILIAILGLHFVALRADSPGFSNPFAAPVWLLRTALTPLVLGYLAGTVGWLIAYAARRSGVHRLAAAQTWIARR